jgi:serine protease Do
MSYGGKQTLYDILDLPRNATRVEIEAAYQRIKAEMDEDTAMPDARRIALLRQAHEVLLDEHKRAAYDASLRSDRIEARMPRRVRAGWVAAVAGLAAAAVIGVMVMPSQKTKAMPREALSEQAVTSVARVLSIDVAGKRTAVALATTVEEGSMATTCHGIKPGAQLVVNNGILTLAATVSIADNKLDVCKLSVPGGASRPPVQNAVLPRAGDRVHVAVATPDGIVLEDASIVAVTPGPAGSLIGIDQPVAPGADGGAVFDAQGKLVGITTSAGVSGKISGLVIPIASVGAARSR